MMKSVTTVTGFILAGGKSSRMGSDKSFLVLGHETLLERAIALLHSVTGEMRIVGAREKFSPYGTVISDIFPERGPLGGIHAALAASGSDWNLIIGVDLPFLEARFLTYLVNEAQNSQAVVTVARTQGRFQPLCAVYHRAFLAPAEAALSAGRNKVDALFAAMPLRVIDENELEQRGYSPFMFCNLNTPADWDWAQRQFPHYHSGISQNDR